MFAPGPGTGPQEFGTACADAAGVCSENGVLGRRSIAAPGGGGGLQDCPNKGVGGVTNRLAGPSCPIFDNDVFRKC